MKKNLASQLGFWASVILVVLGVIYILLLVYTISKVGFDSTFPDYVQLVGSILTLVTAQVLVVLFTAIHFVHQGDKQIFGSLGVSFVVLFAATVSINRFIHLMVIQPSLPDIPADLTRFLPYGPGSVMFALEILGWGFFSSLAAVCVAPLFSSSPRSKTIGWLFLLYAVLSFMSIISFAANIPIPFGPMAWGPILLVLSVLLSVYFRRLNQQVI
jgi:hypothetical protein